MAHFAQLDANNIVTRIIVVDDADEANGEQWCSNLFGGSWKQTSYNATIRKNFAGVGFSYDPVRDAFIAPQPFPSWSLDTNCQWQAPTPCPGPSYRWNEPSLSWVPIVY